MLDRYTITLKPTELALVLGAEIPGSYRPLYNAAPTKSLPVIVSSNPEKIIFQKWGLMAMWPKNKTMSPKFFNLSAEAVLAKSTYRKKMLTSRCVIPMDGFYIWKHVAKKQQIPYYFFFPDRRAFLVAALWEENDEGENSFIMITREANREIAGFQEDMPAIMDTATAKKWLTSEDIDELQDALLKEPKNELISHTVSPRISDIDADDSSFIKPAPASDQHGNYTLFT